MSDFRISFKIADGDMIARKACYYSKCITAYRNRYQKFINEKQNSGQVKQKKLENFSLVETMSFAEAKLQVFLTDVTPFIKLSTAQIFVVVA